MSDRQFSGSDLKKKIYVRFGGLILVLIVSFFLTAGTFAYWQAWIYSAILVVPMLFVLAYLLKNAPELLERRLRTREKEAQQNTIVKLSYPFFILAFVVPGFDKRFGWSTVPVELVIAADLLVLLGYGIVFMVFRENQFASRVIEVEPEQKVISSGPYAIVRHPMYVGVMLMYAFSPLALGSYWALIPGLMIIPTLVARIQSEETILSRELKGYTEYVQKTQYRLIPGLW